MRTSALRVLALLVLPLLVLPGVAGAQSFTPLGDLPPNPFTTTVYTDSRAFGVSDDGRVVVGVMSGLRAFRWTSGIGMVQLAGNYNDFGLAVSSDGAIAVGVSNNGYDSSRWAPDDSRILLDDLGGQYSGATGISADGSVIVGYSRKDMASNYEALRWTSAGLLVLTDVPGLYTGGLANGVSADGSTVVGLAGYTGVSEAFMWTEAGGMVGLRSPTGAVYQGSVAYSVSADGTVVAGSFGNTNGDEEAMRWTATDGMIGLGDLPGGGNSSRAQAISGDGRVIVGIANGYQTSGTEEAFIWTQEAGMQRLFDALVSSGAPGLTGWTLRGAYDISTDGQWIVGYGVNPLGQNEAFRASLSAIPIPPAVWLFGSALGLVGVMRRRQAA